MAQSDRFDARAARVAAWKARAAAQLAAAAEDGTSVAESYGELAATVVGMFDAGARDAEVATFLRRAVVSIPALRELSDTRLAGLAADLHRAAGGPVPHGEQPER
jgi:hypothetical protein